MALIALIRILKLQFQGIFCYNICREVVDHGVCGNLIDIYQQNKAELRLL
jgi:hypothetical protein